MDTTNQLKPFDLEKALAGEPVVLNKVEHKVIKVYHIPELTDGCFKILVVFDSGGYRWCSSEDLRMAPKKVTRWVNFYKDFYACHYASKKDAEDNVNHGRAIAIAVPVEIEE